MKIELIFAVFCTLLASCSCIQKPGRPDIPICTVTSVDAQCTNAAGDFRTSHNDILGTTIDGYQIAENYIDQLELKVRELERQIAQGCKENDKSGFIREIGANARTGKN